MNKKIISLSFLLFFILSYHSYAQNKVDSTQIAKPSKLFRSHEILPLKLSYSIKDIKKNTNDSTYIKTTLSFKTKKGNWHEINIALRKRGHYRLKNCYFPPIKLKIKKTASKGTLFKGNKKLKLVFPCSSNKDMNDYILNEYMAYKLYEIISPYHFNTRLVDIAFTEIKGKKNKKFNLKGILIEDDEKIAKRYNGKVLKRDFHPLKQDALTSIQNAFFQFLIGNTDFSTAFMHNEKLLYINSKVIPVPYDFDMCGLVNSSYSFVSEIPNNTQPLRTVRDRIYRGFKRDPILIQQVRTAFLNNKNKLIQIVERLEPYCDNLKKFESTKNFINDFFEILQSDVLFKREILDHLRIK